MQLPLRRSLGLRGDPPPPCEVADLAFLDPDGIARRVHGDLASMLVGGLAALFLQTLHPLAMAGVAEHSDYRSDPLGRLQRTARFVGTTTYGSRPEAEAAIAAVRRRHDRVTGVAPDGREYAANAPELLRFVHATELYAFATASRRYGPEPLSLADLNRYCGEVAPVALALGADWVPETWAELEGYLEAVRPELSFGDQARDARQFLLTGVARKPHEAATYKVLVAAAVGCVPPWARTLLELEIPPLVEPLAIRPVARLVASGLRVAAPPYRPPAAQDAMVSPPSTTTT